jgi:hypothetical protein
METMNILPFIAGGIVGGILASSAWAVLVMLKEKGTRSDYTIHELGKDAVKIYEMEDDPEIDKRSFVRGVVAGAMHVFNKF